MISPGLLRAAGAAILLANGAPCAVRADDAAPTREFTSFPGFAKMCMAFVTGHAPIAGGDPARLVATFGHYSGDCDGNDKRKIALMSVSQESDKNNHVGAANYNPDLTSYMGDFDYDADMGKWIRMNLADVSATPTLSIALDTINYHKTNVTGWPLQFGHLFTAFNDLSVNVDLDKPVYVEFDIRIRAREARPELYAGGYSGSRVMLGGNAQWTEADGRSNTAHFIEVDLAQSDGYTQSYHDPMRPLCGDQDYDRCYYDRSGKYAEGREVRFQRQPYGAPVAPDRWTHIRIPISDATTKLPWVSPPRNWASARLKGLYIGIESEGATRNWIELRNYHVRAE